MNENIDLTKILKDCPYGWEFYSSVYGNVQFENIMLFIPLSSLSGYGNCKSIPVFKEKPCKTPIKVKADGILREFTSDGRVIFGKGECVLFPSSDQRDWSKFTAPWSKKERFDPHILQKFDKVLIKHDDDTTWNVAMFSHLITLYNDITNVSHLVSATIQPTTKFCVPYNDDTKHLVGTTDEAPEYYRYWED